MAGPFENLSLADQLTIIGLARSRAEDIEEDYEENGARYSMEETARLANMRRIFAIIDASPGHAHASIWADLRQVGASPEADPVSLYTAAEWREVADAFYEAMPAPRSRKASEPWDKLRIMLTRDTVARRLINGKG